MLRVALVVAAVAIALAACDASQGTIATPAAATSVTIRIPHSPTGAASRGRLFIGSTTESISFTAVSTTTHATVLSTAFDVTPTSQGCATTASVTTCTETFALPPDSYTASVVTYNRVSGTGFALSSAQLVPFTVLQGVANSVPLTLYGVPTNITIAASSSTTRGSQSAGFTVYGSSAQTFTITAKDDDGEIIVGAGAPTWSVSDASGSGFTLAGPTAGSNTFTITATGNVTETLKVANADTDASVCAQTDAVCSTTMSATRQQLLFYIDSAGTVRSLAPPYTGTATAVLTGAGSGDLVNWLAHDADGDIFVSQTGSPCETRILAPPYTSVTFALPVCGEQIAVDDAGDLFVAGREYTPPYTSYASTVFSGTLYAISGTTIANATLGSTSVVVAAAPYATPEATIGPVSVNGATAIALDSAGDLFVPDRLASGVDVFLAPLPSTAIDIPATSPHEVAVDHLGNLFASSSTNGDVYEYKPPFSASSTAVATISGVGASRMIFDANNTLFTAAGPMYEIAPPYSASPTPLATIAADIYSITLTP